MQNRSNTISDPDYSGSNLTREAPDPAVFVFSLLRLLYGPAIIELVSFRAVVLSAVELVTVT
jgi:hypothetical protein